MPASDADAAVQYWSKGRASKHEYHRPVCSPAPLSFVLVHHAPFRLPTDVQMALRRAPPPSVSTAKGVFGWLHMCWPAPAYATSGCLVACSKISARLPRCKIPSTAWPERNARNELRSSAWLSGCRRGCKRVSGRCTRLQSTHLHSLICIFPILLPLSSCCSPSSIHGQSRSTKDRHGLSALGRRRGFRRSAGEEGA